MQDLNIEYPISSQDLEIAIKGARSELETSVRTHLISLNQTSLQSVSASTRNLQQLEEIEYDKNLSKKYFETISSGIINGFKDLNDPLLFYQINYWKHKETNFSLLVATAKIKRKKRILFYSSIILTYFILNIFLLRNHA